MAPCQRHLAPPGTSIELAQTHGALDSASRPSRAVYADAGGQGRADLQVTLGAAAVRGPRREHRAARVDLLPVHGNFGVPYLPDVLGCGASLLGLPGAGADRVNVEFGTGWPDRRAIMLVVRAGSGTPVPPPSAEANGPLTVHAPKASVSTVRLSSLFAPGQLGSLKLWQWLTAAGLATPALEELIRDGGHYMLDALPRADDRARRPAAADPAPGGRRSRPAATSGMTYAYLDGSCAPTRHRPSASTCCRPTPTRTTTAERDRHRAARAASAGRRAAAGERRQRRHRGQPAAARLRRHQAPLGLLQPARHHPVPGVLRGHPERPLHPVQSRARDAHPPTPQGYPVDILSSQRPPACTCATSSPPSAGSAVHCTRPATSRRIGNILRVYLGTAAGPDRGRGSTSASSSPTRSAGSGVPAGAGPVRERLRPGPGLRRGQDHTPARGGRLLARHLPRSRGAAGRADGDAAVDGRRRAPGRRDTGASSGSRTSRVNRARPTSRS